jgi:hypothetical protein
MPEVPTKTPPRPLEISKLTPQANGDLAITINGAVFGRISAHPFAVFVLADGSPVGHGTRELPFSGRTLKIQVKMLERAFWPEHRAGATENNKLATEELLNRVVVTEVMK